MSDVQAYETSATAFAKEVYRGDVWVVFIDPEGNLLYYKEPEMLGVPRSTIDVK